MDQLGPTRKTKTKPMAHVSQEDKKRLAGICKTALAKWPGMKWTLSVRHHTAIVLTIAQGDIDFAAAVVPSAFETSTGQARIDGRQLQVNEHYIDRDWSGKARAFLLAAKEALNTGNFDHSDLQSDYFHVGWYVDIQIGRWNKPYRFIGAAPAPTAPARSALEAEPSNGTAQAELLTRMNDAANSIEPYVPVYPKRRYGSTDEVEAGDIVRMDHRDHLGNPIESPQFDDCVIAAIDAGLVTLHRPYMTARGGVPVIEINVFRCELGLLVERFSVLTTGHDGHKSTVLPA